MHTHVYAYTTQHFLSFMFLDRFNYIHAYRHDAIMLPTMMLQTYASSSQGRCDLEPATAAATAAASAEASEAADAAQELTSAGSPNHDL